MSGEKTYWRLPTGPFRGLSGQKNPRRRPKVAPSVYLSDGSTSGFIIAPEFDALPQETTHKDSIHTSHPLFRPPVLSSSPLSADSSHPCDIRPTGLRDSAYLVGPSRDTSAMDDLKGRLGSAYEHIRSMSTTASPRVVLSSDPQMLRKQLGVPQHSVLNYAIHSSPDLPNPHPTPPCELESPRLLPATAPDVSHARTPILGLRSHTTAHSRSHRRRFSDPCQSPTSRGSMITKSTLTDDSLQSSIQEAHRSAHISPNPSPQTCITIPSKTSVGTSSISSSRRRKSRGTLQKPATDSDTPSSFATVQNWRISLPQIRPPSPFKVDVPLHHTWHDRRTDFDPSAQCRYKTGVQCHETKDRTGGNTEVLTSLAWIGTPPVTSLYVADGKRRSTSSSFLPDHLSKAIAMEDDNISNDVLVDRLEKVRKMNDEHRSALSPSKSSEKFPGVQEDRDASFLSPSKPITDRLVEHHDVPLCVQLSSPLSSKDAISDSGDTTVWQTAKKALLCVREIVRTERKYQEALKMLLNAQTATPPPPSMTPHVSALVRASEMLLRSFMEDPSAWGVSAAFVTSEDELEATMVSWCAVAGAFFTDANDHQSSRLLDRWRIRKPGATSGCALAVEKRASVSSAPQLPPMFSTVDPANKMVLKVNEESHTSRRLQAERERERASVSTSRNSKNCPTPTGQPPTRKPSVRDLAIQPIQRVMRYVLLYRDLLHCTPPTSPSHLLVERALEAAGRIADHCDNAQRNPAFYHAS